MWVTVPRYQASLQKAATGELTDRGLLQGAGREPGQGGREASRLIVMSNFLT